jgi:hypothetical protein
MTSRSHVVPRSFRALILVLTLLLLTAVGSQGAPTQELLRNWNFDQEGDFLPFSPNHYVARGWLRWWDDTDPLDIPEYDDVYKPYPKEVPYDGLRAQTYFKWGRTYTAGIYQIVDNLMPCTPYRLQMYVKTTTSVANSDPGARVGLDPTGTALTLGADFPDLIALSPETVWSTQQTTFGSYQRVSVSGEPYGTKLTVIAEASPRPVPGYGYYATTWDAGSLVASNYPGNALPLPESWEDSGFISRTEETQDGDTLQLAWTTSTAALSQVWYRFGMTSTITDTSSLTYTVHFPLVHSTLSGASYSKSPIGPSPEASHAFAIEGLPTSGFVRYYILARQATGTDCITRVSGPWDWSLGD